MTDVVLGLRSDRWVCCENYRRADSVVLWEVLLANVLLPCEMLSGRIVGRGSYSGHGIRRCQLCDIQGIYQNQQWHGPFQEHVTAGLACAGVVPVLASVERVREAGPVCLRLPGRA